MQQRSSSSSSRCTVDDHRSINVGADHTMQQRRRTGDDDFLGDGLPIYNHRSATVRKDFSRSRSPEKWIHALPVLVLLCFFTLWWFSFPVDVEIKDGRITAIRQIETPILLPDTRIDLTILAVAATSPIPSIPQNLSGEEDETHLRPVSSPI